MEAILLYFCTLFGCAQKPAESVDLYEEFIKNRGTKVENVVTVKQDEKEIKKLLSDLNKYANRHEVDKILSLYDKNFISHDGFTLETYGKVLDDAFKYYKNIRTKSEIKHIFMKKDEAFVTLLDKSKATVYDDNDKFLSFKIKTLKTAFYENECSYMLRLKKTREGWKIVSDHIIFETCMIRNLRAKDIPMLLTTPQTVEPGQEYTVKLDMDLGKNMGAMVDLSREVITWPSTLFEEKYKVFPKTKTLERVIRANETGYNENIAAYINIGEYSYLKKYNKYKIDTTGYAIISQRVNVKSDKRFLAMWNETKNVQNKR